jgi:drug/metabolite transporter (DMT)-like permease
MGRSEHTQARSKPVFYYFMYVLAMLIFGTNGLLVAHISFQGSQIVLMRTLLGGIALTVLVLLRGGFDRAAVRAEAKWLLLGGAALGFNWVALFEAYRLLNVSLATLIYYVGPMLILLLSPVLFHEKLTPRKLAAVAIVAAGLVCISGSIAFSGLSTAGLLVAILSALFYASLIAFNKRIVRTGGMQTAALELDVAFFIVLVYVLFTSGLPHPRPSDLPYIAVIGFINTGLAYLLYFSGLQKLPGQSVALISYVDPVSALVFSAVLLHETMTPVQMLGAVLIIGGAMYGELK